MQPFTAIYSDNKTIVPLQNEADSLYQDGYGEKGRPLVLMPYEALYNVERGKIKVINEETNSPISFRELIYLYSLKDEATWIKFIVYKDLRTRGFRTRKASSKQAFFEIYNRGEYHKDSPSYLVYVISEGTPEKISDILNRIRLKKTNTEMKLAVVDRRGEIVYYSVCEKEFDHLPKKINDLIQEDL
jgi:tRNA-intron endonuclease